VEEDEGDREDRRDAVGASQRREPGEAERARVHSGYKSTRDTRGGTMGGARHSVREKTCGKERRISTISELKGLIELADGIGTAVAETLAQASELTLVGYALGGLSCAMPRA